MLSLTAESLEAEAEQARQKYQTVLAFSNLLGVLERRFILRRSDSSLCVQSDEKMIGE